jgi:hypothetical protein
MIYHFEVLVKMLTRQSITKLHEPSEQLDARATLTMAE